MLMWSRRYAVLGIVAAAAVLSIAPAAAGQSREKLEMYTWQGSRGQDPRGRGGVELAGVRQTAAGIRADVVLTAAQRTKVAASGVKVTLKRNSRAGR